MSALIPLLSVIGIFGVFVVIERMTEWFDRRKK